MYEMQILMAVEGSWNKTEWRSVRPTNGKPYQYETRDEAERMLRQCYPDVAEGHARVIEIGK